MKIYKITEASDYLGVSINTLKTLANNKKKNFCLQDIKGNGIYFANRGISFGVEIS